VKDQYGFGALQDCSKHFKVYKHGVLELDSTAWGFVITMRVEKSAEFFTLR
jgi:hypothetical protein